MSTELNSILPHRAPMVMIDELIHCGDAAATAVKTFKRGDYGTTGGRVLEPALVESLAQTVAAFQGCRAQRSDRGLSRGMLVGVSHFDFRGPVSCEKPVHLSVTITRVLPPFCLAEGHAEQDGQIVAQGELKFFLGG